MKQVILSVTFLLLCLCITGCNRDPIVGLWETTTGFPVVTESPGDWDGRPRMRFEADGKYSSLSAHGSWHRIDDNHIVIDGYGMVIGGSYKPYQRKITFKVNGDFLTITEEDGTVSYWRRVN